MDRSSTLQTDSVNPLSLPDNVSVRRWFSLFGVIFAVGVLAFVVAVSRTSFTWADWKADPQAVFSQISPGVKLLGFALYLSLCCTFLPLPTGGIVAAVATRQAAVASGMFASTFGDAMATTMLVALSGAVGSTLANLNDYHMFTWLLRHGRIAKVRNTRTYHAAARWFGKAPFFLLVVFNVIPIPVDVVRMLATTYRYGRSPFAAANFIGRFIRYGVIAFVTYWWDLGWVAVVALLGIAVVLAAGRIGKMTAEKLRRRANDGNPSVSGQAPAQREKS